MVLEAMLLLVKIGNIIQKIGLFEECLWIKCDNFNTTG